MSDEIDEKWWDLFKANEEKGRKESGNPTVQADQLLTKFETDLKRFDNAKKELADSISRIIPALEEEKKALKDEIEIKSRRVQEIEDQIKAVTRWTKKHRDLLESKELPNRT